MAGGPDIDEAMREMGQQLEAITDIMQSPPPDPSFVSLVQDLLQQAEKCREKLANAAYQVSDQGMADGTLDRITTQVDKFDKVKDDFRTWSGGAGGAGAPDFGAGAGSRGPPSMSGSFNDNQRGSPHSSPYTAPRETGADDHSRHGAGASESGRRKKDKKDKKKKKESGEQEDRDAPTPAFGDAFGSQGALGEGTSGGFGAWGSATGTDAAHTGGMADASPWGAGGATSDGAWPAAGGSGGFDGFPSAQGFPDAGWGASDQPGPGTAVSSTAAASMPGMDTFGGPGGFGATHTSGGDGAGFGAFGDGADVMPPAGTFGSGSGDNSRSHHGSGAPQRATLKINCPFSQIETDIEGFKHQFQMAAAQAVGIPPHRIVVRNVRASN